MSNDRMDIDRLCGHVVRVAGTFAVVVALALAAVTVQSWIRPSAGTGLWSLPVLESHEMREMKARLASEPKNETLKQDIRRLDLMLRAEHFRREAMMVRGAWLLLAALATVAVGVHVMASLRKRPPMPGRKTCPEGGELALARRGRWAVGALSIALGGGGGLLAVLSAGRLPGNFQAELAGKGPASSQPAPATRKVEPAATQTASAPVTATQTQPTQPATGPAVAATQQAAPAASDYPTPQEIARNWPRFRGPGGAGVSAFTNIPLEWDLKTGKNVAWTTPVPLQGTSSPVVWGDRVFVTSADRDPARPPKEDETPPPPPPIDDKLDEKAKQAIRDKHDAEQREKALGFYFRQVHCLDLATGKLLWTKHVSVPAARYPREMLADTGLAAPTPVTDGRRVYVLFATGELAALDFEGRIVWQQCLGDAANHYGHASSLEMYKGRLIVQFDQGSEGEKLSSIQVFDGATGTKVKHVPRPKVVQSWASPILISTPGGDQFIALANPRAIAYDPNTWDELWEAEVLEGDGAPSPIYVNGLVIAGNTSSKMAAIRPDGKGDVTGDSSKVLWAIEDNLPDICSPVSDGLRLYLLTSDGLLRAYSLADGKDVWPPDKPGGNAGLDLENEVSASPSLVGDKLVVIGRKGVGLIIPAGPKKPVLKDLPRMGIGEETVASPAFVDGRMILRTKGHVICIGKKGP